MENKDVAAWMMEILQAKKELYQEETVYNIHKRFGDKFTYINGNGNLAIAKGILTEFNKISGADVVWSRGARFWRFREKYDKPGRQQD
jgi:hypothetical protein